MSDNRPIAYYENDKLILRASAIGSCLRALVASALEYEPGRYPGTEKILMDAAGEGVLHEPAIIERMQRPDFGYDIIDEPAFLEWAVTENVTIRGHTDAGWYPHDGADPGVVEIKTMSKSRYAKWESEPFGPDFYKYNWQLSAYIYALADEKGSSFSPALYVVKNRDSGTLHVTVVDTPIIRRRKILARVEEVLSWVERAELPPCDPDVTSGERYFCPFVFVHDDDPEGEDESTFDSGLETILAQFAEEHYELSERIKPLKPLEEERKRVAALMEPHLTAKSSIVGDWSVRRVDGSYPKYDFASIAEELGLSKKEFDDKYRKRGEYTYFKVEPLEDEQ